MTRFPQGSSTTYFRQFSAGLGVILLAGCASSSTTPPAVEIPTVEVVKEVQRPCPVTKPDRPAPLARPLPTDPVQLAALLTLKLLEYAAPGGYADRADAAIATCTAPI
jgi:hypothetical protein